MQTKSTYILEVDRLFEAVDVLRRDAGKTWTDVAREVNTNRTTLVNMQYNTRITADLLVTLMRWLQLDDEILAYVIKREDL